MKKLLAILLALLLLTACAPKEPPVLETPDPQPPAVEVTPEPAPEEESALGYAVGNAMQVEESADFLVTVLRPVLNGENQQALDIINEYFELLQSKVLDFAQGDLTAANGEQYEVVATYDVNWAEEHVVSFLWLVHTTEKTRNTTTETAQYFNFDPTTGNLITFRDIFPDADGARSVFVQKAREIMEADEHLYYEHAADLADSALDTDDFSYTGTGIAVHYSADAVGAAVDVELTWEELADYLET